MKPLGARWLIETVTEIESRKELLMASAVQAFMMQLQMFCLHDLYSS
jgi:hypothetical protein